MASDDTNSWELVPGFNDRIRIFEDGSIQPWDIRNSRWYNRFQPPPGPLGYRYICHNGARLAVHDLVCTTFHGPRPTPSHTVDHIAKYDGDWKAERSDNRSCNLRWATKEEQRANMKDSKVRTDSRPIVVWEVGEDESTGVVFGSAARAAKALGLDEGNLSQAARKGGTTRGFKARKMETEEPELVRPDEAFRTVRGFRVSQYGRFISQGGFPVTPKHPQGGYVCVQSGTERNIRFHNLVAEAWPDVVGPKPDDLHTVDHIDKDHNNNFASNLRWATGSEQKKNQSRRHRDTIGANRKQAVQLRIPGSDWMSFVSYHSCAHFMSAKLGRLVKDSTVSRAVNEQPAGYTFKRRNASGWTVRRKLQ